MKKLIVFILSILILTSCVDVLTNYQEHYIAALDNLDIQCDEGVSEINLTCTLDDDELCHYDGANQRRFSFTYAILFETEGPVIGSSESSNIQGKRGSFTFYHTEDDNIDDLRISFPIVPTGFTKSDYLEFLFSKDQYLYSDADDKNVVIVQYRMKEKLKYTTGSNVYDISSEYGTQEDSYFKFENVVITEDDLFTTYSFEFQFECELYYNPQYRSGQWRSLKNGILKGEITVEKDK